MSAAVGIQTFEVQLDEWLAQSEEVARLKFIDVCLEAAESLVNMSPVDTGFFRSMWSVLINQTPDFTTTVSAPKTEEEGVSFNHPSPMATMTAGLLKADLDTVVWIVNPTEYGPALEDGHSKQAPNGMVGPTWANLAAIYGKAPAR